MPSLIRSIPVFFPLARSAPVAVLFGAAILACPLPTAHAEGVSKGPFMVADNTPAKGATVMPVSNGKRETIEERIVDLHTKLKITADETAKWNDVAQVMRENAAQMEKLITEKRAQDPKVMTAVADLMTYQKFSQAHVDGLKNLIAAVKVLYESMPKDQKALADQTFLNFGRGSTPSRG